MNFFNLIIYLHWGNDHSQRDMKYRFHPSQENKNNHHTHLKIKKLIQVLEECKCSKKQNQNKPCVVHPVPSPPQIPQLSRKALVSIGQFEVEVPQVF